MQNRGDILRCFLFICLVVVVLVMALVVHLSEPTLEDQIKPSDTPSHKVGMEGSVTVTSDSLTLTAWSDFIATPVLTTIGYSRSPMTLESIDEVSSGVYRARFSGYRQVWLDDGITTGDLIVEHFKIAEQLRARLGYKAKDDGSLYVRSTSSEEPIEKEWQKPPSTTRWTQPTTDTTRFFIYRQ